MNPEDLVGKSYQFEDGNRIEITQVKRTDPERGGHYVTYNIITGPGVPRRLVMPIEEFLSTFAHLFKDE
jgi:hypothetical protein